MAVGRVNWYGNLNHWTKEAALLNASPILPISFGADGEVLTMTTPEALLRDLADVENQEQA